MNGLMNHTDSPYIRALGFMYLRYTQPPGDLFDWYEEYLQDEEEIDVKAGGGQVGNERFRFSIDCLDKLFLISSSDLMNCHPISFKMTTIGQMLFQWLTKLDWFCTLFPRIPVPIQKQIESKVANYCREHNVNLANQSATPAAPEPERKFERGRDERGRDVMADNRGGRSERDRYERPNRNEERCETSRRDRSYRSRSRDREPRQR